MAAARRRRQLGRSRRHRPPGRPVPLLAAQHPGPLARGAAVLRYLRKAASGSEVALRMVARAERNRRALRRFRRRGFGPSSQERGKGLAARLAGGMKIVKKSRAKSRRRSAESKTAMNSRVNCSVPSFAWDRELAKLLLRSCSRSRSFWRTRSQPELGNEVVRKIRPLEPPAAPCPHCGCKEFILWQAAGDATNLAISCDGSGAVVSSTHPLDPDDRPRRRA